MPKRKDPSDPKKKRFAGEDESSSDDEDLLNVDFEFFAPQAAVDFHGLKMLLRQLLDADAPRFDLSALADLILSQPTLGSTVKVESNETDPYAFLTVLNLKQHKDKPVVQSLTSYLNQQSARNPSLAPLVSVLASDTAEVGLILTERLVNVPIEIAPPMYRMLAEEIQWALEDGEPYRFTHYLILSKTYCEVASKLDREEDRPKKKQRGGGDEVFYFHPEDEVMHGHAMAFGDVPYLTEGGEGDADAKRAFQELGIRPQGHMILIDGERFQEAFEGMLKAFPG